MFVGLIVALSAVGIDLTALSVLGGAIGVGVGLGLQKLAANYVSGFVILAERSMRIGDNVRVDGFEAASRYQGALHRHPVAVRARIHRAQRTDHYQPGRKSSLADSRVWISTVVSVGYDSDVDVVMPLLAQATLESERVLRDPAPSVALSALAPTDWSSPWGSGSPTRRMASWACVRRSTCPSCALCGRMALKFPSTARVARRRRDTGTSLSGYPGPAIVGVMLVRESAGQTGWCWPIINKSTIVRFMVLWSGDGFCVFAALRHRMFWFT